MEDNRSAREYHIHQHDTTHLMRRLRGGATSTSPSEENDKHDGKLTASRLPDQDDKDSPAKPRKARKKVRMIKRVKVILRARQQPAEHPTLSTAKNANTHFDPRAARGTPKIWQQESHPCHMAWGKPTRSKLWDASQTRDHQPNRKLSDPPCTTTRPRGQKHGQHTRYPTTTRGRLVATPTEQVLGGDSPTSTSRTIWTHS